MYSLQTILNLGLVLTFIQNIPWEFLFLFTKFFGIRYYTIIKKDSCLLIQKRSNKWYTRTADNDKGYGYTMGYWYLMHVEIIVASNGEEVYTIKLIATEDTYKKLTETNDIVYSLDEHKENNKQNILENSITIWDRRGSSYHNSWFKNRKLKSKINPRHNQQLIINKIVAHQLYNNNTVVYLHGEPNTGKSMIGLLLANYYNSSYCNTFIPWIPGMSMAMIYDEVSPTEEKPLIIVLEEFDTAILKIHHGIEPHKSIHIAISDKMTWNNFMDSIKRGIYPHVIILLTSNKNPDFINSLDPSYIRMGRVDLIQEIK